MNEIYSFLLCTTPTVWLEHALNNQAILLADHAHCEKKAASTALSLLYRYVDKPALLQKMSRLAREELRHFEQVHALLGKRNIEYISFAPCGYIKTLYQSACTSEPYKLIDTLIIGAIIEARSCERFAILAKHLDNELSSFYNRLLVSEVRHYMDYLTLAKLYAEKPIDDRIEKFLTIEANYINSSDSVFRFHSGIPSEI